MVLLQFSVLFSIAANRIAANRRVVETLLQPGLYRISCLRFLPDMSSFWFAVSDDTSNMMGQNLKIYCDDWLKLTTSLSLDPIKSRLYSQSRWINNTEIEILQVYDWKKSKISSTKSNIFVFLCLTTNSVFSKLLKSSKKN